MRFTKSFKPQTMARGCQAQAQSAKFFLQKNKKNSRFDLCAIFKVSHSH